MIKAISLMPSTSNLDTIEAKFSEDIVLPYTSSNTVYADLGTAFNNRCPSSTTTCLRSASLGLSPILLSFNSVIVTPP